MDIAHGEQEQGGSGMFFLKGEEIRRKERREKTSLMLLPKSCHKPPANLLEASNKWLFSGSSEKAQLLCSATANKGRLNR